MALEPLKAITRPEPPFQGKEPSYQEDPGYLAFQAEHGLATYPEYLVYWWLTTKRGYEEFRDFWYQVSFGGGRQERGGMIADFVLSESITSRRTVLEVMGQAFHTRPVYRAAETLAMDVMRKAIYESLGFEYVRVLDTDLVDRLDYTMSRAILGIEIAAFR